MTSPPASTLRYGKVVYRVFGGIGDGPDAGALPDLVPVTGSGTLTPMVDRLVDQGSSVSTVLPRPVPVAFVAGRLTYRGEPFVWLLASQSGVWRWHAQFTYKVGAETIVDEFYFDLPPGEPNDPDYAGTDLSTARIVLEHPSLLPTQIGPPGRSVSDVQLLPDGLVFVMSSGDDIAVTVPSLGDLSNAASNAAASATTATSAASSASTAATNAATSAATAEQARLDTVSAATTATAAVTTINTLVATATEAASSASSRASIASSAASNAQAAASEASTKAAEARSSATTATTAATTATSAASTATSRADEASNSATSAATSASNAASSAATAEQWAEQAVAVVIDGLPNAAPTVKGGLRLAGDLAGTWDAPRVPALASKADLIDGQIPTSQIPAVALTKPHVVASETAMLALDAQTGDVAVRSDGAGTFMLAAEPAYVPANWVQLAAPDLGVDSINGQTGTVVLGPADIGAAPASHGHTISSLMDLTPVGAALATATTTADARTAIGAGTSSLMLGTSPGTAKAGDWKPASTDITDASSFGRSVLRIADGNALRSAIGAMPASKIEVVSSLPSTGVDGVIYLVRKA